MGPGVIAAACVYSSVRLRGLVALRTMVVRDVGWLGRFRFARAAGRRRKRGK
jgi:hypothetical protein